MKRINVFLLLSFFWLLASSFFVGCTKEQPKTAQKGVLDLRDISFSKETVALDGEWDFAWQKLYEGNPIDFDEYYTLPTLWPGHRLKNGEILPPKGYGVWHLKVLLPLSSLKDTSHIAFKVPDMVTAYELYVNGKKIGSNGKVSKDEKHAVAQYLPNVYFVEADSNELEIYLNISNYHGYTAGQWDSILLGKERSIVADREFKVASEVFFIGILFLLGLYHIILFFLHDHKISYLVFATFTFIASFRISITGERYLIYLFPKISWVFYTKIEYLTFYLAIPFFVTFLSSVFPHEVPKKFVSAIQYVSALFILVLFLFPIDSVPWTIPSYQIITGFTGLFVSYFLLKSFKEKRHGISIFFFGWGIFFVTLVNDMLVSSDIIHTPFLSMVGVFFFILGQAYTLALQSSLANREVTSLTKTLQRSNRAFLRFVPQEFLAFLGKKDITDISLGEQVKRKMTILFSDIRSFTEISESLKLKENFDFVNNYFILMGPIIRGHNGFIDKYLGDGIMALFPKNPKDALDAALQMQEAMLDFNRTIKLKVDSPVKVGIGIHTGHLMLGTIGEHERMQGSVISDAVNLSSRLEALTQKYGADIIVSKATFIATKKTFDKQARYLGFTKVKGKKREVEIYEIFAFPDSQEAQKKIQTREIFEKAIELFFKRRFVMAKKKFTQVLATNSQDKAARWFLEEIKKSEK